MLQHAIAYAVGNSRHDVFLVAAPISLTGMLVVTLLRERPLRGPGNAAAESAEPRDRAPQQEHVAA